jgi:DNA-binding IclR family transcriptional regulator
MRAIRTAIAAAGLGADWDSFRATLRAIREAGHCGTVGKFPPGVLGIAAPLFNGQGVLGSLCIAAAVGRVRPRQRDALAARVMEAAKEACTCIAREQPPAARPARAVG